MNRDYSNNEYSRQVRILESGGLDVVGLGTNVIQFPTVQAQLRICAIDNSNNEVIEYDDILPAGLNVRMNDKQCALPVCIAGSLETHSPSCYLCPLILIDFRRFTYSLLLRVVGRTKYDGCQ